MVSGNESERGLLGPTKVGGQEEAGRMKPGRAGRRKTMRPRGVTVGVRPGEFKRSRPQRVITRMMKPEDCI